MPQNKAMVRPNPINRPRSTRRYPGPSKHAHWLGFSGVARSTCSKDCGLWFVAGAGGPGMPNHNVRLSSPCYLPHSWVLIPVLRALRAVYTPLRGRKGPLFAWLCHTAHVFALLHAADWLDSLTRHRSHPEAAGLARLSGGSDQPRAEYRGPRQTFW